MEWEGKMCIVSGSYQSIDLPSPRTVVELWCRAEEGHSVLLLVHGLRPYFDIAVRRSRTRNTLHDLESVSEVTEVMEVSEPVMKWTRPRHRKRHWRVYADHLTQ